MTRPNVDEDHDSVAAMYARTYGVVSAITHWILWVQASLEYKQRLQQLFFPEGIAYDGNRFNRTAVMAPLFNYLAPDQSAEESLVSPEGIEPSTNRLRVIGRAPSRRRRR